MFTAIEVSVASPASEERFCSVVFKVLVKSLSIGKIMPAVLDISMPCTLGIMVIYPRSCMIVSPTCAMAPCSSVTLSAVR